MKSVFASGVSLAVTSSSSSPPKPSAASSQRRTMPVTMVELGAAFIVRRSYARRSERVIRRLAGGLALAVRGAKELLVRIAQAPAHLARDVHLDQRELLDIVLEQARQVRRRQRQCLASLERAHRRAAREQIEQGHLTEAIARAELAQQQLATGPILQHLDAAALQHVHAIRHVALAEEERAGRHADRLHRVEQL